MLNYETLLSSYDDKLTLMQWLKKVEAALKDASAVAFNVTKTGDATLTFSLDFEDGSKIESGPIVLQQGESVASAYIQNGNLHLVLTNGDDLDAGNMFNGDVNVTGNVTATGTISAPAIEATGTGIKTDVIQQKESSGIDVYAAIVHLNNGLEAQGEIESLNGIRTPVITADEAEIAAQKPIVEVMAGYSFTQAGTQTGVTLEYVYAGIVKNGNKLTLVVALNLTKTASVSNNINFGTFTLPSAIYEKLYPTPVGGYNFLDNKVVSAFKSHFEKSDIYAFIQKVGSNSIVVSSDTSSYTNLELNIKYYCRYEATFLLSENLAA